MAFILEMTLGLLSIGHKNNSRLYIIAIHVRFFVGGIRRKDAWLYDIRHDSQNDNW